MLQFVRCGSLSSSQAQLRCKSITVVSSFLPHHITITADCAFVRATQCGCHRCAVLQKSLQRVARLTIQLVASCLHFSTRHLLPGKCAVAAAELRDGTARAAVGKDWRCSTRSTRSECGADGMFLHCPCCKTYCPHSRWQNWTAMRCATIDGGVWVL